MKTVFCLFLIVLVAGHFGCISPTPAKKKPKKAIECVGPYLGQVLPQGKPQLFAPGFICTGMTERDAAFTPDLREFYFCVQLEGFSAIVMSVQDNTGKWSKPQVAPFSGLYNDFEPCIAPDGKTFYFVSHRPLPGTDKPSEVTNIWTMTRQGKEWVNAVPVGEPVNCDRNVYFPSVTRDGTLYFNRREKDETEYIYRSRRRNGKYLEPEKLDNKINSTTNQFNSFIAPDESFLIVSVWGRPDTIGSVDYYISFRNADDVWSELVNLGKRINTRGAEYSPYISPDGKYFFFNRLQGRMPHGNPKKRMDYNMIRKKFSQCGNGNSDIYWVSADFIKQLKQSRQ